MTNTYNYHLTHFLVSSPDIYILPSDSGIEIAFIGSSNSGKSSAINILTNQKNLARASKTPGRTRLINIFEVKLGIRIVDFPGYGYIKTSGIIKEKWRYMLNEYLKNRNSLKGTVILMDIRHPMKDLDKQMIKCAMNHHIPIFILLTKAEKFSFRMRKIQLNHIRQSIAKYSDNTQVELFSSIKNFGVDKLREKLDFWYNSISSIKEN